MTKRILSVLLALCLVIGALPLTVLADEPDTAENDELFAGYVERLFYGSLLEDAGISTYADVTHNAGSLLSGDSRKIYDQLKAEIIKIAKGERESTTIYISGVPYSKDMILTAVKALRMDYPYELFWEDKASSWGYGYNINGVYVSLSVAAAYSKSGEIGTNEADMDKIRSVQTAAANAKKVVEDAVGLSDYMKLVYYKNYICGAVTYNYDAYYGSPATVGSDPWQLIYVFDDNPNTNIVCEGYAKAFQYLCDLTDFADKTIQCYSVRGNRDGGGHMWNIVAIGTENYLVDVTNCDAYADQYPTIEFPNFFFLVGKADGTAQEGYTITTEEYRSPIGTFSPTSTKYFYDDDQFSLLGDVLNLSATKYDPSSAPVVPAPEDDFEIDGNGKLIKYKGSGGEVVIPNGVTSIGMSAFKDCTSLTGIEIPDSVTSIGEGAFSGCTSLTSVKMPNSLTSIGNQAFSWCTSLTGIEIPDSVTSIGYQAFNRCTSLTSIVIPDGVTSIGHSTFNYCTSLTSVVIPDSVTNIDLYAFENCSSLTSIVIPDGVTSISVGVFRFCSSLTSIVIPDGVTSIDSFAFEYCSSLTSIVMPDSVTSISWEVFFGCNSLENVYYGGTQEQWENISIGSNNEALARATIHYNGTEPDDPTPDESDFVIDENGVLISYRGSGGEVVIPNGVTSIGNEAFELCSDITSIKIPNGVTSIGDSAFSNCERLTSIEIPGSVTSIGDQAFSDCIKLTSIKIPNSVTSIGAGAFRGCIALSSVNIPNRVTSISDSAFSGCSRLTKVDIPSSVTSIGNNAFSGCSQLLTRIDIPKSVTTIGRGAFNECNALNDVYYDGISKDWNKISIGTENDPLNSATKHFTGKPTPVAGFNDVFSSSFCADAVAWAVESGITNGTGNGKFSPNSTCTRGQIVTFLWRAAGSPEPTTTVNPFIDVPSNAFCYKAVLWAVANNVTNGTTKTTFSPKSACTRAQAMSFIWKAAGRPDHVGESNPFKDVYKGRFYYDAVLWGVEKSITNGVSNAKFGTNNPCTRAQIVTFLYRWQTNT